MTDISIFAKPAISYMREEILKSHGNEIFFVAKHGNEDGISEIKTIARGNENEVPVIFDEAFKGDFVIHNHPSGKLTPSENDLAIAAYLGNQGIGFLIVNNSVTKIYVVVEGVEGPEKQYLETDELVALIDEGGRIVKYFDNFELRQAQIDMLHTICQAFNQDDLALIEAGTGVGKSMAYLIPAIYWSVLNKEKVIISTNTINLQEQLYKKDIPFLQKALEMDFKAVLMKGRGNYLCLKHLNTVKNDPQNELFELEEKSWVENILNSVDTLKEGTKDELTGTVPMEAWGKVACEVDTCLKSKCRFYTQCFFYKARKEVNQANILVVNHHLLCSDIAIRGDEDETAASYGLFPPYQKIIIDEAHNLEHVAVNYLGHSVSQFSFKQMISRLFHLKGAAEKGVISFLKREITKRKEEGDYEVFDDIYDIVTDRIIPDIMMANPLIDGFFQFIMDYADDALSNQPSETTLRIIPDRLNASMKERLNRESSALIQGVTSLYDKLTHLLSKLDEVPFHFKEDFQDHRKNIEAYTNRLIMAVTALETFVHFKENDAVYWLERKKRQNFPWIRLNVSPLNISDLLHDFFFSKKESIILTSATLTTDNNFNFLKKELGLTHIPSERLIETILPSPFDYLKQMSICIPTDIPSPQDKRYSDEINELLKEILEITQGKTFVLFTSYGMLNHSYEILSDHFGHHLTLLKQGAMDRHTLINRFKNGNDSVLLGTDSFWEGVDVAGDALRCVILVKLPFRVPTEPITQGKVEKIEKEGRNSFFEYSIPQSVIKFRQGFGRLIRSKEDRGVVLCLDKRIITKSYGKIFIHSLPPCHQIIGNSIEVLEGITDYF